MLCASVWYKYAMGLFSVCHGIVLFINTQASQMNLLWVLRIWEHILTSKVCSIYNHFLLSVLFYAKMIATSDEWEWLTAVFSSWWQVFVNGWQLICLCVYILRHPRCWITSCDGGGGSVCLSVIVTQMCQPVPLTRAKTWLAQWGVINTLALIQQFPYTFLIDA